MDTRWNGMDKDPGQALERRVAEEVEAALAEGGDGVAVKKLSGPSRRLRAGAAAAAFFLGVSLLLGSLLSGAGNLGTLPWLLADWRETPAFREAVEGYLESFLTLGAGEDLDWYDTDIQQDAAYGTAYEVNGGSWWSFDAFSWALDETAVSVPLSDRQDAFLRRHPDAYYLEDKNVLYTIRRHGTSDFYYSNLEDPALLTRPLAASAGIGTALYRVDEALPEGYGFVLVFHQGQVSICQDGTILDVYGDGTYREDSLWRFPGYENFPAGEGVEDVTVLLAVRDAPVQYLSRGYSDNPYGASNRMYWIYRDFQNNARFWRDTLICLLFGAALAAVWLLLRRDRLLADRAVARVTRFVPTEVRFLAVAGWLTWLAMTLALQDDFWWTIQELWYESAAQLQTLVLALWPSLGRTLLRAAASPALLGLGWTIWLIRNDHRYNPKESRRSRWRLVSVRMKKYPFQKRTTWLSRLAMALACMLPIIGGTLAVSLGVSPAHWLFWLLVFLPLAAAVLIVLILRKHAALARDIGLVADRVEAIRGGDLSTPLDLPADADLRQTAERLNDIQAGLRQAVADQTRSERMKVELISNVSHDLKTPLTSILSYAQLLCQEELPPAAADYARIIDEKAHRLKSMVQDVFEVSKAAAGQLPVEPERLDLGKLLRQTLADLADPIAKSRLTFKADLPEDPVMVTADGRRLYRVFQNLIDNSLQYALEGSRVYLSLKAGEGRAEASLRNTSRSELPEGVDFTARFVRGDDSRTDGGSGLGLSIASSFTEACGGRFRVETVADLFTATVELPLADGEKRPS